MMASEIPLLKVEHLQKTYADDVNAPRDILRDVSLTVRQHDFLCILGPSGCGKTTLLRCIAGFEEYSGAITLEGKAVTRPDLNRFMVFQDFNQLFPWKTVRQNICFPLKMSQRYAGEEIAQIAQDALQKVSLPEYGDYYPHQLSGGMKQRVALARALALRPKVVLMDEPFASLDAITRKNLQDELLKLWRENDMTVIFVTHNIQEGITIGNRMMVFSSRGAVQMDEPIRLTKPVLPSTPGYGELWDRYHQALSNES